jgi:uncharacterized membrane protein YebE (DUF533 family)
MSDVSKILNQFLGSSAAGGFAGGLAGGLTSSMLTSKKGRKLGKKALKMGGMAAVGAMAYGAFQKYNSAQSSATQTAHASFQPELQPAPPGSSFMPAENDMAGRDQLELTLVRAMIAAARSDGTLDAKESQAIFQRIQTLELPQQGKDLLLEEMGRPVDMDAIVNAANTPEVAAEIYVASLLAIDVDTVEEQSYLGMLAARLKLPRELVTQLHEQVENQVE